MTTNEVTMTIAPDYSITHHNTDASSICLSEWAGKTPGEMADAFGRWADKVIKTDLGAGRILVDYTWKK